jgi:hypothetical protein
VNEDTVQTGNVLTGTVDVDGSPLSVTTFTVAGVESGTPLALTPFPADGFAKTITGVGTIAIDATGTYTFTPDSNYSGLVPLITYTVSDGTASDTSTLQLAITPMNDAPTLSGSVTQLADGTEDNAYTIGLAQLLEDFTDVDSAKLSVINLQASHGTVTSVYSTDTPPVITGYTITPSANHNGQITLTYDVSDGDLTTLATRTLNLSSVADNPVTTDDSITFNEDAIRVLSLSDFGTYSDADNDALFAVKFSVLPGTGDLEYNDGTSWVKLSKQPTDPDIEITASDITAEKLRFVPVADTYSTTPSLYSTISFQVKDASGAYSATQQLAVNVLPVPDTTVNAVSVDNLVNVVEAAGAITISGTREAGDEIRVSFANFTDAINGSIVSPEVFDSYFFSIASTTDVKINLDGMDVILGNALGSLPDPYLELYRVNSPSSTTFIAFDDDSGDLLNSEITSSLVPGNYEIRARDLSSREGEYLLTVVADGATLVDSTIDTATWSVSLPADYLDAGSNPFTVTSRNTFSNLTTTTSHTLSFDNELPVVTDLGVVVTVSGSGGVANVGDTVTMSFTAVDADIGSVTADFSRFGGGTAVPATFSSTSGIYTATYTLAAGTAVASNALVGVSVTDIAGNVTTLLDGETYPVDIELPNASVSRVDRAGMSIAGSDTRADELFFKVQFTEPVSGVGIGDFVLALPPAGQALTTAAIKSVSPVANSNGTAYLVHVAGGDLASFNGEVGITFADGRSITDEAGNALISTAPTTAESFILDNIAPFTNLPTKSANENQNVLYTADSTADARAMTYSLGGLDAALLQVSNAGVVSLNAGTLNAEGGKPSYSFDLIATDAAGNQTTSPVTVSVNDINEFAPVFASGSTASIAQNVAAGTVLYTAQSTDADATGTTSYAVAGGGGLFAVDPSSGVVSAYSAFDFSTALLKTFAITATNGSSTTKHVLVHGPDGASVAAQIASQWEASGFSGSFFNDFLALEPARQALVFENVAAGLADHNSTDPGVQPLAGATFANSVAAYTAVEALVDAANGVDPDGAGPANAVLDKADWTALQDAVEAAGGVIVGDGGTPGLIATGANSVASYMEAVYGHASSGGNPATGLELVRETLNLAAPGLGVGDLVVGKVVGELTASIDAAQPKSLSDVMTATASFFEDFIALDPARQALVFENVAAGLADHNSTDPGVQPLAGATFANSVAAYTAVEALVDAANGVDPDGAGPANAVLDKADWTALQDAVEAAGGVIVGDGGTPGLIATGANSVASYMEAVYGTPSNPGIDAYPTVEAAFQGFLNSQKPSSLSDVIADTQAFFGSLPPVISTNDDVLKIGDIATVTFTFAQPTLGFSLSQIQSDAGTWVPSSLTAVGTTNQVWTAQFTPNSNVASASSAFTYRPTSPVSKVDTVTLVGTPEIGDEYTITVDGVNFTHTVANGDNLSSIQSSLIGQVNHAITGSTAVTASAGSGNTVLLTAKVAGVNFTATSAATNHAIDATEDATLVATTANVVPVTAVTAVAAAAAVAQVSTVSLSGLGTAAVAATESVTVTVGGKVYTVNGSATVNTVAKLAEAVNNAISTDANAKVTSTYTAGATGVTLTAKSIAPTFTLAVADTVANSTVSSATTTVGSAAVNAVTGVTGVDAVAQVNTVTLVGKPEIGDQYAITVNDVNFTHTVAYGGDTLSSIQTSLISKVNDANTGSTAVTASAGSGYTVLLTAKVAGTTFTASAAATDRAALDDQAATLANTTANVAFNGVTNQVGVRVLTDSAPESFTVDTQAPTLAVSSAGPVGTANVVSSVAGDNVLTGTAEIGSGSVTLKSGITTLGTATVAADGAWSYSLTPENITTLGQGANKVVDVYQTDAAGNTGTLAKTIAVDTVLPTVSSFATTHADGNFKASEVITITATSSETLVAGSTITATLSTGATVNLVAASNGTTLTGNYTVAAGQNTADLTVNSYTLASGNALPKDMAGNLMSSTDVPTGLNNLAGSKAIVVDTVAPGVTLAATSAMADGRVNSTEMLAANGVASVTAEAGTLLSVTFTGTAGSITRPLSGGATGSAQSLALQSGDDMTLGQGNVSVSVTATDAAGNATTATGASFNLRTVTTATDVNGSITPGQMSVKGVSNGSVIKPHDGDVLGSGDKLNLSNFTGDVIVDNVAGQIFIDSGSNDLSSLIDISTNVSGVVSGFDVITTGAGDDRIIGNDGLSEVLFAGSGYNQINGGNSAGKVDYVDYRSLTVAAVHKPTQVTVSSGTTSRTVTFATSNIALGDVYSFQVGSQSLSVVTTQSMTLNSALLVSAMAAQLSIYTASGQALNGLTISSAGNVLTLTATGALTPDKLTTLVSSLVVTSQVGVNVDLANLVTLDPTVGYASQAYMAVHSDGSKDELSKIEGVLGTAYSDIITGGTEDNVFLGGAGNDIISGNSGNDVLVGGSGNDVVYGGADNDRIIGGSGSDVIYGGTGKDTIVIGMDSVTTSDSIRDFEVSSILTSSAGRSAQALDKIEFNFSRADLATKLGLTSASDLPANLVYQVSLANYTGTLLSPSLATAATPYSRVLELSVEHGTGNWVKVSEVRMDWESNPFGTLVDPDAYILSAIKVPGSASTSANPALLDSFDPTSSANHQLFAALQFQRVNEIIDTTAAEAIVGARTGDFFVMSGGNDILVGGLGSDRYEARIIGDSDNVLPSNSSQTGARNNGRAVVNDLGRSGGGLEQDAVFIEGARHLGDLTFSRTQIAGEENGRTLNIAYHQYRGIDDPLTVADEVGMHHASGQIDIFNQFSLTQGDLYSVEKIQLASEVVNPLAAAVTTYYFGSVTGASSIGTQTLGGANGIVGGSVADDTSTSIVAGDVLNADSDRDSLLIGTVGKHDTFVIDKPTSASAYNSTTNVAADSQDVWIYGMAGTNTLDNDDVVVKIGDGTTSFDYNDVATLSSLNTNGFTMAIDPITKNGVTGKMATVVLNSTTTSTNDDVTLNIFFADAGNVDSTTLLNRIKWES